MQPITVVLICIAVFVVAAAAAGYIGFRSGITYRKKIAEAEIGSAEEQAKVIVDEAAKEAENKRKEAVLAARDEIHKMRSEA